MTLTEFLLARIAEDEKFAQKARGEGSGEWASWNRSWDETPNRDLAVDGVRVATLPMWLDEHACRHDPARVLADCEAKRQMLGLLEADVADPRNALRRDWAAEILRGMGSVYANHPDFRDEWRP